jgi:hypothetical protein
MNDRETRDGMKSAGKTNQKKKGRDTTADVKRRIMGLPIFSSIIIGYFFAKWVSEMLQWIDQWCGPIAEYKMLGRKNRRPESRI